MAKKPQNKIPIIPGPSRSEIKKVGSQPRLTNHKSRSIWFQSRVAWPVREPSVQRLIKERSRVKKELLHQANADWQSVGPTNIGGRLTSIVCHPQQPERIWVGAAGGGVWYSPDAGKTWLSQWHKQDVLNVGSLAIDYKNPNILYCGTGEANLSADSYPGVGIYKTTDSGKNWKLFAPAEKAGIPNRIGVIAIDPFNSQHIRIAGIGYGQMASNNDFGGMYYTLDGGKNWMRETFISSNNYWCHCIVFHPQEKGVIFATFTERGARNGIYRSMDGGKNWTQLTIGLPDTDRIGRTTLAISPSNPDVIYAFAADLKSDRMDLLLGVFRSHNGGNSWVNIAGNHFIKEGQISYGNTIAVHPTKPNFVICGGVDLHISRDGGKTWDRATKWNVQRGRFNYAHADHHCLLMSDARPGLIYDCNDGGLDVSEDAGKNWENRSNGLAITMYYDLDVAQSDGRLFGGGSQDNGTLITQTGASDNHFELLGGDGGWIVFDRKIAGHIFASYQNLHIYRFKPGEIPVDVSPSADEAEQDFVWMAYIALDPNNSRIVFSGSYRVWRSKDDGNHWTAVSPSLDDSQISAIEIARANSKNIYVGTEDGGLFRSLDGGENWSANLAGATLPGYIITRLATDPRNANHLFATVANFGHSHVYASKDGGISWQDIDRGQLPDVPHHCIAIRPDAPDTILVCNDVGVFMTDNLGSTWTNLSGNLPNTIVVDLVYHVENRILSAATYGRSIWRLKIS
ncbi:MAG: hypothetical protein AB1489_33725 [Acidobacteriota bacterium]